MPGTSSSQAYFLFDDPASGAEFVISLETLQQCVQAAVSNYVIPPLPDERDLDVAAIGQRMKSARWKQDRSIADVAKDLDLSESELQAFEDGTARITHELILRICDTLQMAPAQLMWQEALSEMHP